MFVTLATPQSNRALVQCALLIKTERTKVAGTEIEMQSRSGPTVTCRDASHRNNVAKFDWIASRDANKPIQSVTQFGGPYTCAAAAATCQMDTHIEHRGIEHLATKSTNTTLSNDTVLLANSNWLIGSSESNSFSFPPNLAHFHSSLAALIFDHFEMTKLTA